MDIISDSTDFTRRWVSICEKSDQEEAKWIADLRLRGFKAAHPNDGWVDRKRKRVTLVYPQFNDGVNVGDLVMLGWPSDPIVKRRPIRIISKQGGPLLQGWAFEDVDKSKCITLAPWF